MSANPESSSSSQFPVDPYFIRLQIEQSMETYRAQFSLLVQVLTVMIVGDITVIGYGVNARSAGVMLVGALFPILGIYITYRVNKLMMPVIYTAVTLEQKLGKEEADWLASTFVATVSSLELVNTMKQIGQEHDPSERLKKLRRVKLPIIGGGRGLMRRNRINRLYGLARGRMQFSPLCFQFAEDLWALML